MTPAGKLQPRRWMTAPATAKVMAALTTSGRPARFVGGCVRDSILDREVRDIDIATPCPPDTVMTLLADAAIRAIPTGIDHGTVTAVVGDMHFEITTLRHDVETYGRHAKVSYTDDWAADAERRDFTINALFCDSDGTLYDPTGGLADLDAGVVRFVGDPRRRIDEDALRILRFFRFHAYYGRGAMAADDFAACAEKASNLAILSGERVAGEMLRLLAAADPVPALRKMDEAGVLQRVLPGAAPDAVLPGLVAVESAEGDTDPVRRLAALLPVSPEAALTIAERLRLSNRERDRLVVLVAPDPSVTADLQGPALRRVLYAQGRDRVRDRLLLAWAAESADESAADAAAYRRVLAAVADWSEPDFPLRGADVLALGVPPGPDVGDALDQVRQWWIEGDFAADRPQLLAKLAEIAGDRPSP